MMKEREPSPDLLPRIQHIAIIASDLERELFEKVFSQLPSFVAEKLKENWRALFSLHLLSAEFDATLWPARAEQLAALDEIEEGVLAGRIPF